MDWLGRRPFNDSYRAGGMFDSIRSMDMKPDMLKSVDSNWGDNMFKMEIKRNTLNDSGYQRDKGEIQPSQPLSNSKARNSMLTSKQPQVQPSMPDLSLRKVDSEEIDNWNLLYYIMPYDSTWTLICGIIYSAAWSVSFYGQIYENWKYKSYGIHMMEGSRDSVSTTTSSTSVATCSTVSTAHSATSPTSKEQALLIHQISFSSIMVSWWW